MCTLRSVPTFFELKVAFRLNYIAKNRRNFITDVGFVSNSTAIVQ